jgi:hypothetical protein
MLRRQRNTVVKSKIQSGSIIRSYRTGMYSKVPGPLGVEKKPNADTNDRTHERKTMVFDNALDFLWRGKLGVKQVKTFFQVEPPFLKKVALDGFQDLSCDG